MKDELNYKVLLPENIKAILWLLYYKHEITVSVHNKYLINDTKKKFTRRIEFGYYFEKIIKATLWLLNYDHEIIVSVTYKKKKSSSLLCFELSYKIEAEATKLP